MDQLLDFVSTIRHDGHGGVADALSTEWVAERFGAQVPDDSLPRIVELRRAIRSLFALAVRPDPPSKADANRLMDPQEAVATLNAAARPRLTQLTWPANGMPSLIDRMEPTDVTTTVLATLAQAAIQFLTGPERERLQACPAPRCVLYFVKQHPRQAWCKPSCGNRARVSKYYKTHR
ncbi:CGNR zinc finger domain-containing protein [Allokutzneria sp. A3M-2-11 16]|uniref:CGNR zinc finger domain-containing protein n=1 Tax=Allokutzneria sp. A3M-2-11 16 TaxID=2962043 RepID=UPI0020B66061|nr:ABATE domain-containing protein [Allokutzneria sp. A3M-2-11 16]MCP3801675.1 CGNR zinc finger domain-containing protein [Allokutzneria sp. A3M-2-11 16]